MWGEDINSQDVDQAVSTQPHLGLRASSHPAEQIVPGRPIGRRDGRTAGWSSGKISAIFTVPLMFCQPMNTLGMRDNLAKDNENSEKPTKERPQCRGAAVAGPGPPNYNKQFIK